MKMIVWWQLEDADRHLCRHAQGMSRGHFFRADGTCAHCGLPWSASPPPCIGQPSRPDAAAQPTIRPSQAFDEIRDALETIKRDEAEARRLAEAQETTEDPAV
jgi:hypothetical protein